MAVLKRRVDMDELVAPFKVRFSTNEVERFLVRARAVLESGWLIPDQNNADLEQQFARFIGRAEWLSRTVSGPRRNRGGER
jgi:hypothetical protein